MIQDRQLAQFHPGLDDNGLISETPEKPVISGINTMLEWIDDKFWEHNREKCEAQSVTLVISAQKHR